MLREDDRVFFYPHAEHDGVLDTPAEHGTELTKPKLPCGDTEYGFSLFMDCLENGVTPETALADNYLSFAMVAAAMRSSEAGKAVSMREFLTENCGAKTT